MPLLPSVLIPAILTTLINQCIQLWIFQVIQTILPKCFSYFPPKLVGGDSKPIVHFDANTSVEDFPDSTETSAEEEVDITILSHEVDICILKIVPKKAIATSSNVRIFYHRRCAGGCIKRELQASA